MPRLPTLCDRLPPDWKEALSAELQKPWFTKLETFLAEERNRHPVLPPEEKLFAALHRTPLHAVKVVLLGQDPYPTAGNANGLSFSVEVGQAIPGSLRNMFKVMAVDVEAKLSTSGDLTPWAEQGVLLLNTVLTVREGEPNSHRGIGWEHFTKAVLDLVDAKTTPVVFLLLGKHAQNAAAHIDATRHVLISAPHPSPGNPGNPFGKTRPFSAVNEALMKTGHAPIRWELTPP